MELNNINNEKIKGNVINYTNKVLLANKVIKPDELSNVEFHFGYVFSTDNGELEALFKAMINNRNYYFAIQKNKFLILNLNEALYNNTILNMKRLHPCLNDENAN